MITKNKASCVMIQGTASSSGKSLICAALCRILHQDGYRVAPFKAQNMSNNSYVTHDGLEMGRAQVVQAYACGLEPDVRMNPVLLKPSSDTGSQVIIKGRPSFNMNAAVWHDTRDLLRLSIRECYESLAAEYDCIVIEGAGSPAEINLKKNDIVNMGMAKMADAPVIIVGDIDRGGVFASLVGTMQLLEPDERARVKGFIINKFRGNVGLLEPGLDELERLTGVAVLGVVPWINHTIDDEDGVSDRFEKKRNSPADIDICILRLPHISNFTDFIPLETVPGVRVRWCTRADMIGTPDLLIIPGTKATISDLKILKKTGIAEAVINYARSGGTVLGICGGFQMLGMGICDPHHVESASEYEQGLGLIDMKTIFHSDKSTAQSTVKVHGTFGLFAELDGFQLNGYEIHMGQSEFGNCVPFTSSLDSSGNETVIGAADKSGRVAGTYCHGLFDSDVVAQAIVGVLRTAKGLAPLSARFVDRRCALEKDLDTLAAVVREQISMENLYRLVRVQYTESTHNTGTEEKSQI
ncbi:MAG: cobyric acid synthase [Chitinispirillaceae bacterium]